MYVLSINLRPGRASVHLNFNGLGTANGRFDDVYKVWRDTQSNVLDRIVLIEDDYGHRVGIDVDEIAMMLVTDAAKQQQAAGVAAIIATKEQLRVQAEAAKDPVLKLLQSQVQTAMQRAASGLTLDS